MAVHPGPLVRLANVDGDLVILDLADDSYLCLARAEAQPVLDALCAGTPCCDDPALAELIESGLLTESGDDAPWTPLVRARPRAALPELSMASAIGSLALFPDFLSALWRTFRLVRRRDANPWSRLDPAPRGEPRGGENDILMLADRFRHLRCLVPLTGRCLIQSLMLILFLRRRGVEADWVFGVRTHPFEAHCWVEWRGIVLNDGVDHVSWYTPIAVF